MKRIEVVVLNGSPGSGKNTTADCMSDILREKNIAHAVIDLELFITVYPYVDGDFVWSNLADIWPNYVNLPKCNKIIIPILIDKAEDLNKLHMAMPGTNLTIIELIAETSNLIERVTKREPNEYWKNRLRGLVKNYSERSDDSRFGQIKIRTDNKSPHDVATEVLDHVAWVK